MPDENIIVVHRSDGSGTTYIWSDYLSAVSPDWEQQVGRAKSMQLPVGTNALPAPGNEGVASGISETSYSIGYIELVYALTNDISVGFVQNQERNFIEPTLESTQAAVAASAPKLPSGEESWSNVTIVNAPRADSYPIVSFSYILLSKNLSSKPSVTEQQAKELVDFINWVITDGQRFAPELEFVPLPANIVQLDKETLNGITFNGIPLMNSTGR